MSEYPFSEVEKKIQQKWEENEVFKTKENPQKKYYVLEMFAYPSGDLHVGHLRNYVIVDLLARYYAQNGFDVLHPVGWDAFGLPAEEAAIKKGIHPLKWTKSNVEKSKNTLKSIGIGYDWNTEIMTCSPDYYKWTQWIFLKLYENGLAYQDTSLVNWCPKCQTVLANEQVEGGRCWRCHSEVTKRDLKQWFFKITQYAQQLLDDLVTLKGKWPEQVITAQKNWIGRSEGAEIDFSVIGKDIKLRVFTTRPDTLWGVTFAAIAPEHKKIREIISDSPKLKDVENYINKSVLKTEIERISTAEEKTGIYSGIDLEHPMTGEKIPLFVCDYVLASYGTGVVMGVPAHDSRDFAFAKKHGIAAIRVIMPSAGVSNEITEAFTDYGILENSGEFSGMTSEEAIPEIIKNLENQKKGNRRINFKLHDWLVSRQRYWGAPIPMIHCEKCGVVPVPEEDLPVLLPENVEEYTPKGKSVLAAVDSYINVKCPKCGAAAKRDPDTLDTFVDSSWYQFRYPDSKNDSELINPKKAAKWLPIDKYVGGIEHATGHLIYFRFITKVLNRLGIVPCSEPALQLFNHGMVCGADGSVMSKSKGNGVEAGQFVLNYGADVCRVNTLFLAPPGKDAIWSEQGVSGAKRFLDRIWRLGEKYSAGISKTRITAEEEKNIRRSMNMTVKKVTEDIENWSFNTAIASMMEFVNDLVPLEDCSSQIYREAFENLIRLLAPFAPHIAEELWEMSGMTGFVADSGWPCFDTQYLQPENEEIAVQVNGKLRDVLVLPHEVDEETAFRAAFESPKVKNHVDGRNIMKKIFVPHRMISIVIK
ncbi:leucine--tRNA ligase [candidate division WOR-3 bacterium]|nr:leucine--tRNA ligase [candidate division WOR-3 bacterium]